METVKCDVSDHVAVVTMSRPPVNAVSQQLLEELTATFDAFSDRDDVRAAVLTGAGKVFSAGADLDEARAGLAKDPVWERLSGAIASLPCLTVAALNGTLAGGAFGMVLACDLRIAVPEATFFYPVMKLGFLPQPSDPGRLAALVGPARAKLILMAGARLSAAEAFDFGLVDKIVPRDSLEAEVAALCQDALGAGADHVASIKALF